MGHGLSVPQGFIVESLGMAARSVGFAVPGALGIQEGGFILACGLFGFAPDMALALSMLKRLREIAIGSVGLLMWQWSEISRLLGGLPGGAGHARFAGRLKTLPAKLTARLSVKRGQGRPRHHG
jgi:hypothetical protein